MTGNIQVATTVLGGLALFIYGMGLMSEGLTQVAGARMKGWRDAVRSMLLSSALAPLSLA